MNRFIDLNRIEFVVTDACSGRCKHCSNGDRGNSTGSVDANVAIAAIKQLSGRYSIRSVMTFGGEPLLYPETVCKIHTTARDCRIPERQLITNGFFSNDEKIMDNVAQSLCESGVTDILLSVDIFHQEYIPLGPVMRFADSLAKHSVLSLRVHPAWVVNEKKNNPYNIETKRLLKLFADKGIQTSGGNDIFFSGNALKNLAEYFPPSEELDLSRPCGSALYTTKLDEVDCLSIGANGDVNLCSLTIGNINTEDIVDIIDRYDPFKNPVAKALLEGGVAELLRYAKSLDIAIDTNDCRSACGVCRIVMDALKEHQFALL